MSDEDFTRAVDIMINGRARLMVRLALGMFACTTIIFIVYAWTHPECL